jgi:ribosomal protein S18 acetylase RimI-like enzyme
VRRLAAVTDAQIEGLARLLVACVEGGASVGFVRPLSAERAIGYWRQIAAEVARGERALLVAEDGAAVVGTVQLVVRQPENQPHRADLSKLLVDPSARRRGLGEALMRAAEVAARECGKTLLVLDTATAGAERLYVRLGWRRCGTIPNYALLPHGGFCDTTFFYLELPPAAGAATGRDAEPSGGRRRDGA